MTKLSKLVTDAINHPYTRVEAVETPWDIYQAAARRMELTVGMPDPHRLRDRWPTLGDANRTMVAAYADLTPEQREYDRSMAEADLALAGLGLI